MTCWVVVPIKAPAQCKTRLQPALSDNVRQALVSAMLRRVVECAGLAETVDQVLVLGPSLHDLPPTTPQLPDLGEGLNAELARATRIAATAGVRRLVIIAADLPAITPNDVETLSLLPADSIAIAADRAGKGTNALVLPLPAAQDFEFQFGPNSFSRHSAEAARLGLRSAVFQSESMAYDVDEPADLASLPAPFDSFI